MSPTLPELRARVDAILWGSKRAHLRFVQPKERGHLARIDWDRGHLARFFPTRANARQK